MEALKGLEAIRAANYKHVARSAYSKDELYVQSWSESLQTTHERSKSEDTTTQWTNMVRTGPRRQFVGRLTCSVTLEADINK